MYSNHTKSGRDRHILGYIFLGLLLLYVIKVSPIVVILLGVFFLMKGCNRFSMFKEAKSSEKRKNDEVYQV